MVGGNPATVRGMTEIADPRVETETPDLEITLPARAENVAVVRHAVGGLGEVLEVDDQTLSDIKLAVTEACTNVVVHAYPDGEGPMGLRASVDEGLLRVVVAADEGGLELRVGSLAGNGASGLLADAELPGVGNVFERVADEVHARTTGDGPGELVLRLRFASA